MTSENYLKQHIVFTINLLYTFKLLYNYTFYFAIIFSMVPDLLLLLFSFVMSKKGLNVFQTGDPLSPTSLGLNSNEIEALLEETPFGSAKFTENEKMWDDILNTSIEIQNQAVPQFKQKIENQMQQQLQQQWQSPQTPTQFPQIQQIPSPNQSRQIIPQQQPQQIQQITQMQQPYPGQVYLLPANVIQIDANRLMLRNADNNNNINNINNSNTSRTIQIISAPPQRPSFLNDNNNLNNENLNFEVGRKKSTPTNTTPRSNKKIKQEENNYSTTSTTVSSYVNTTGSLSGKIIQPNENQAQLFQSLFA
jgi:hypothetical protein